MAANQDISTMLTTLSRRLSITTPNQSNNTKALGGTIPKPKPK